MRYLICTITKKRGCQDCTEVYTIKNGELKYHFCKHNECPFHELDKYNRYEDYLKAQPKDMFRVLHDTTKRRRLK